jgi:hypothetical protein
MRGNPGLSRNHPINERQELFCREFLVDYNGTQAAVRAGYSKPSAHSQASYLLRQPKIKRRIAELAAEQRERVTLRADLTLERLLNELNKIAPGRSGRLPSPSFSTTRFTSTGSPTISSALGLRSGR